MTDLKETELRRENLIPVTGWQTHFSVALFWEWTRTP